jgi:DNA (cytosine-5)-methyltransferase 1
MRVLGSAGRDHSRVIPSPRGPSTEDRVRQGLRPGGSTGKVVELFAGVGGFRLALEAAGWDVIWANQWEPSTKTQHAFDCYVSHFNSGVHVNEDINVVLDQIDAGECEPIPDHDLLVGGFPCQDYSVAKTLNQAHGIEGKKGVLWWSIYRILEEKRPRLVFLENVDRLLKSPATQRGRDFAIILACLSDLGYLVEWRVANAAEYGFPQRRRRVFIIAHRVPTGDEPEWGGPIPWLLEDGALAAALPVRANDASVVWLEGASVPSLELLGHPAQITQEFGWGRVATPFQVGGVMWDRKVWTQALKAEFDDTQAMLGDILLPDEQVPEEFFVPKAKLARWKYLKGAKSVERVSKGGHRYEYSEGAIAFPDSLDQPSRTILTGEGGATPSRFKHIIRMPGDRFRRLTPIELERLNGFPDDWTHTGMPDGRRAFMMGNALVVGLVGRVGEVLAEMRSAETTPDLRVVPSAGA